MILRRFTKHIKEQNWLAVGLDIIVVVLGLFIGFQIDRNWEEMQWKKDEQKLLIELSNDIRENVETTKARVNETARARINMLYTLSLMENPEIKLPTDDACVLAAVEWIPYYENLTLNFETYKILVSTGDIARLSNDRLRRALFKLEQEMSYYESQLSYFRSHTVQMMQTIQKFRIVSYSPSEQDFSITINPDELEKDITLSYTLTDAFRRMIEFYEPNLRIHLTITEIDELLQEILASDYPTNKVEGIVFFPANYSIESCGSKKLNRSNDDS